MVRRGFQNVCPLFVLLLFLRMLTSIRLNYDALFITNKICNEAANLWKRTEPWLRLALAED